MRKRFFDEGKGPSREDLEREAAAELRRHGVGGPPGGPPGGAMPPRRQPSRPPPPSETDDLEAEDDLRTDEPYTASYDEAAVTEMALRDLAERPGRSGRIEDMAIGRLDPTSAEAMRDRALQAALARQEQLAKYRKAGAIVGARKAQPVFARPQVWSGMVSGLHPEQPPPMVPEAEEAPPARKKAPAKKPAAKKAAKKAAAKSAPAKKKAAAKKAAAKSAPAKKKAAAKKATAKSAPAKKKAAAKKATAKAASKKATPKKAPTAKKTPAKKAAARKLPVGRWNLRGSR